MRALERRIEKLDKQIAGFPCTKPGHDTMFLFWIGDEPSAKDLALFEAIRDCKNCQRQDNGKLHIRFMEFGRVPENSKPASPEPEPISFDSGVHDGTPEP